MDTALIIFSLFCFFFLIQLWVYFFVFGKIAFFKPKKEGSAQPPVSVIICARNEIDNLQKHLPEILKQRYQNFEVVVVDDCSQDDTDLYLKDFSAKHSNLKVVMVNENQKFSLGKKLPLMLGIKAASHEHLLFTDADCMPKSENWMKEMMSAYSDDSTEIVLGYSPYERQKALLNKLIRFDTFYNGMVYLSAAIRGKAYMGVGRNLSYTKSLFFEHKGFAAHMHVISGDDDLFVNQAATRKNVKIAVLPEAHTISIPKQTFKGWVQQKRRHVTTSKYYKKSSRRFLGWLALFQYFFFISFILSFSFPLFPEIILSLFGIRLLFQMIIFKIASNKLSDNDLWIISPLLELFFMIFNPLILLLNLIFRNVQWKKN